MLRAGTTLCLALACCAKPTRSLPKGGPSSTAPSPSAASVANSATASVPALAHPGPLSPSRHLAFQVEQRGQVVPVADHVVTLRREPFTFAFLFRAERRTDLFVNASFDRSTLDDARARRPYRELRGFLHSSRIGQPPRNELRELYVSELGPNQWITNPSQSPPYTDFDTCAMTNEGQVCRYTVEQIMEIRKDEVWRPLSRVTEAQLFLVFFLAGRWTEDDLETGVLPERDRDWLTIVFAH